MLIVDNYRKELKISEYYIQMIYKMSEYYIQMIYK